MLNFLNSDRAIKKFVCGEVGRETEAEGGTETETDREESQYRLIILFSEVHTYSKSQKVLNIITTERTIF